MPGVNEMQQHMSLIDKLLSRLFHDLISPVSATVNGAELISDLGNDSAGELEQEALALIATSSRQASERLSFFRVAFGGAGSTADHSIANAADLARPYLKARKIEFALDCPVDPKSVHPAVGGVKVILGLACMLCECLPRGGSIELKVGSDAGQMMSLAAYGDGATVLPEISDALEPDVPVADLTSRSVVAFTAIENARRFGFSTALEQKPGSVQVTLQKV